MTDFAVILSDLLKSVGPAVCEQPGRVKGTLLDRAPDGKREVTLLMHALEVRAPQRFLAEPTTAARSSLGASLIQRMEDDFGTSRPLAEWAVQTWLTAVERSHGNQQPAAKQAVIDSPETSPQPHTPVPSSGLLHSIQSLMSRSNSGTAEAKQNLDAGDFVGAIVVLEAMPAGLRDNTMLAEAKQRLTHQQLEQQRIAGAAEARRKFEAGDYAGAIAVIKAMPMTMRDSALLAEAKRLVAVQQQHHQNHQRMISLESQLNAAVAAHEIKKLRPLLVQLVALDPVRKDWRDALAQLPVPKPGDVIVNSVGMSFAYIPAGEFLMGAPSGEAEASDDERPQHLFLLKDGSIQLLKDGSIQVGPAEAGDDEQQQQRVKITQPFVIGVHQVTQGQFEAVLNRNPSHFQQSANFPVDSVTWFDAIEFCNALSKREGRQPCYQISNIQRGGNGCMSDANVILVSRAASAPGLFGYRLPTEMKWEYACRAGTTTPFHFGKELNGKQANVDGNHPYGTVTKGPYLQRTTTVGSYPKNAFGLFDMHGNVWEWCDDAHNEKAHTGFAGRTVDPKVTSGSGFRVLRGGSWGNRSRDARAAYCGGDTPGNCNYFYGFRVMSMSVG